MLMNRLRTEAQVLHDSLRVWTSKRDAVARSTRPIMRLPQDILRLILHEVQTAFPAVYPQQSNDRIWPAERWRSPLLQVCKHWRDVLFVDKTFWSTFSPKHFMDAEQAEKIFSLSGNAPLRIEKGLDDLRNSDVRLNESTERAVDCLKQNKGRIKAVRLGNLDCIASGIMLDHRPFTILDTFHAWETELSLETEDSLPLDSDMEGDDELDSELPVLRSLRTVSAPNLKHANINEPWFLFGSHSFLANVQYLTLHVYLDKNMAQHVFGGLEGLSRLSALQLIHGFNGFLFKDATLEKISPAVIPADTFTLPLLECLVIRSGDSTDLETSGKLHLPRLRSLVVDQAPGHQILRYFETIQAPHVETFVLLRGHDAFRRCDYLQLLAVMWPKLRELYITTRLPMRPDSFAKHEPEMSKVLASLRQLQNLQVLVLRFGRGFPSKQILRSLLGNPSDIGSWAFPRLRIFEVEFPPEDDQRDCDLEERNLEFFQLVKARLRAPEIQALETVSIGPKWRSDAESSGSESMSPFTMSQHVCFDVLGRLVRNVYEAIDWHDLFPDEMRDFFRDDDEPEAAGAYYWH